jgi:hypothetical protein
MKTGFFKVEASNAAGHQSGLVYLNHLAKAEWGSLH